MSRQLDDCFLGKKPTGRGWSEMEVNEPTTMPIRALSLADVITHTPDG